MAWFVLGRFISSLTTTKCLYPRPAPQPAILPISNPLPFFLRTNSAPGNTPTSSSQKSYVALEALGEVVIRTLGGSDGSTETEKYDEKGSLANSIVDSPRGSAEEEELGS